ncbi:MAG: PD-(D/E)XK nuclease-like domain-containing protein [Thermoguttaceae bacterium]|nr:PD-(D/E)XK nuclease-like domain-containing protein [Thermoguttaceae bacterium]
MNLLDGFEIARPLERGVWDVDEKTYRADAAVNFHTLADFQRDPRAFEEGYFEKRDAADAMRFGTACHSALLEGPSAFARDVAVFSPPVNAKTGEAFGATTKTFLDARNAFETANAGKTIISTTDAAAIEQLERSFLFHPVAPRVMRGGWGRPEIAIKGEMIVDGEPVVVKGRLDWYGPAGLTDFKSTARLDDASGRQRFKYAIYDYKYLVQLGFYHRLLTDVCGAPFVPAQIVAGEREAPHRIAVYAFTREIVEDARNVALEWLRRYVDAKKRGYYPSPFDQIQIIDKYNPEKDLM